MDVTSLEGMLEELRTVRDDHQTVEVKRARGGLPGSLWETLTAFANSLGGIVILGVDEAAGAFEVTGVENPGEVTDALRSLCSELEPPLRPVIETVIHPQGPVVVATVSPVPRDQRPCFRRVAGTPVGFVRVGDGDQRLTPVEFSQLQAEQINIDYSRQPAAAEARLDPVAVSAFLKRYRSQNTRLASNSDEDLLARTGVVGTNGEPTLAGCLVLGAHPQAYEAAADIAFVRDPGPDAPATARMQSFHLQGTFGELLDDTFAAVVEQLTTFQVERGGALVDESDVPREAIREVLSNALSHRSFTPPTRPATVNVHVSDMAVEVTSPGGLHAGADAASLGLPSGINPLRNLTLVNIAQLCTTPSGARLIEHQGSGIAAADRACRAAGAMPPLFVDQPAKLRVVLLRGRLDETLARQLLKSKAVPDTAENIRLVAVAIRLKQLHEDAGGLPVGLAALDAPFAARSLTPAPIEDAAAALRHLEDRGVLVRRSVGRKPTWEPAITAPAAGESPTSSGGRGDRVADLLAALLAAPTNELAPGELGERLGLSSPASRYRWIRRAIDAGLVEPTNPNLRASNQTYRLTPAGRAQAQRTL